MATSTEPLTEKQLHQMFAATDEARANREGLRDERERRCPECRERPAVNSGRCLQCRGESMQ